MVLSWPSAVCLAVAAVSIALFMLPIEKVGVSPLSTPPLAKSAHSRLHVGRMSVVGGNVFGMICAAYRFMVWLGKENSHPGC